MYEPKPTLQRIKGHDGSDAVTDFLNKQIIDEVPQEIIVFPEEIVKKPKRKKKTPLEGSKSSE